MLAETRVNNYVHTINDPHGVAYFDDIGISCTCIDALARVATATKSRRLYGAGL